MGHCPVTGKPVKSVEEIYAYLDGKIKVWLGFPKDWMDDVRRTVAEVLYESAVRRGIPRTTELAKLVLERDGSIIMRSSKTMRMASGVGVPIWDDGPLEKDALKRIIEDLFNARESLCSDQLQGPGTGLPARGPVPSPQIGDGTGRSGHPYRALQAAFRGIWDRAKVSEAGSNGIIDITELCDRGSDDTG